MKIFSVLSIGFVSASLALSACAKPDTKMVNWDTMQYVVSNPSGNVSQQSFLPLSPGAMR